jgi:uncharacterized protein
MNVRKTDELSRVRALIEAQEGAVTNPHGNPEFLDLVKTRMGRRGFLRTSGGGVTAALLGSAGLVGLSACGGDDDPVPVPAPTPASTRISSLSFATVAKSQADQFTVPNNYAARVIYRTGDPIAATVSAYSNRGIDDPASYDRRAGDNHDGIEYFGLTDSGAIPTVAGVGNNRGMLGMNHEYVTQPFLHAAGATNMSGSTARPQAEVDREVAMHGVSVVEVWKQANNSFSATGTWAVNASSSYNRRVTALTRIELSGPARTNAQLVTKYSPTGTATRGTLNNCGTGYSVWGTLLTCEENWAGYFTRNTTTDNAARSAKEVSSLTRYGVAGDRYRWGTLAATTAPAMAANAVDSKADTYDRWNANIVAASANLDYRNAPNTMGWVVEIDPYDPTAVPKKRTALGRFAHEAAVSLPAVAGQPLAFYMGDDSRGDYIYKFVSAENWVAADAYPANRMVVGDKYLDRGTLHVARFSADGTGTWLPITLAAVRAAQTASGTVNFSFAEEADVLIHTRLAADALGATRMDRPEWGAVNPTTREVYFTLTENNSGASNAATGSSGRRVDNIDAANPRFYADARTATSTTTAGTNTGNPFGHIIRIRDANQNAAATNFTWDIFLFGAQADADPDRVNLSGLTSANDFARADGLWISPTTGLCWVQTDDSGAFLDQSNCMMLAAVPGQVGDGRRLQAQAASAAANGNTPAGAVLAATQVGARMTETTLRRFLVGPRDQEITGVTETPDGRTLFVNVQHPGEETPNANVAANAGDFSSYWPLGERAPNSAARADAPRPLSATVVITKNDGGLIGS